MQPPDLLTQPAPHTARVECEHASRCGGCPAIELTYGEQLASKRGRVVQALARYRSLELVYTDPVVPAQPITGYRTRAKLIVAPGGGIGLYAKGGGHRVEDIPNCRVLAPSLAKVAEMLRARARADEANGGTLAPHDVHRGSLRAVDLREVVSNGTTHVLLTLVVQRERAPTLDALRETANALMNEDPSIVGVAVNYHEGEAPQILGADTVLLAGATDARDDLGGSTHVATFGSFVQAHRGQAATVHALLAETVGPKTQRNVQAKTEPPRVLDLYGGSGAIAIAVAKTGARVHTVESFAPAVERARAAAQAAGLSMTAEHADVAAALRGALDRGESYDAVIVNPPRRGMSPQTRELIAKAAPSVIAYVSCDPDTLARDLEHLAHLGYAAAQLKPIDMIPLTEEVETVAILRRAEPPAPRVAYEDDEIVIVEKPPHEPTLPHAEYARSLESRTRKLPGTQNAIALQRLDVGTSGLVTFVRQPDLVEKWTQVFAAPATRRIFVAGARGVTPSKGAITRELREDGKLFAARTRYRRLAVASGHSVLRVIPEQGRTHQIRRHLAAIGHPVIGDDRYGHAPTNRFFEEKNGLDRTFLHCVRIELDHPNGQHLVVEAPLSGDLRGVLERTSGPGTLRFLDHKNALGTSSSLPPAPDSQHERGSALDVDSSSPTLKPEMTNDDDMGRSSGGF